MAKFNMDPKKHPMPSQDPLVRNKNFKEVALGYDEETAIDEAKRCLNCKNQPCVAGCPVNVAIPEFIALVAEGKFEEAYQVIARTSSLPAVCGRVCPQETQCEGKCTRGIKGEPVGIGRLERFVADWHNSHATQAPAKPAPNGHKVAIVGSGPAGLTCAGDLAKLGYDVTVFEALHLAGGVLVYGIPEFRLPKAIVEKEVDNLKALGVKVMTDMVIGKVLTIDELKKEFGFEAVFLGTGAGLPRFMNIPGENAKGVFSANEYLTRSNLMKAYEEDSETPIFHAKKVAVVGGGNVAMDAARSAKRLGADVVYIVYRKWSTPRRRRSSSSSSPTPSKCLQTATTTSWDFAASRWSWANPTPRAAAAPSRRRAASSRWTSTVSSWRSAPRPIPSSKRRRRGSTPSRAERSSPMRTARRRSTACTRAATP